MNGGYVQFFAIKDKVSMSQVVTLADLPISPAELDEKERVFEQEGQWVEWVRYTREIVQGLEESVWEKSF